jgi:hypothetical protein
MAKKKQEQAPDVRKEGELLLLDVEDVNGRTLTFNMNPSFIKRYFGLKRD